MIESAAVGATFSIEDMVTPALAKINASFKEADELITKCEGSLGRVNSIMGTLGKKAGVMADLFGTAFGEMDKAASATASGVVGSITKMQSDITKQFDGIKGLSTDLFAGMGASADTGVASVIGALGKADTAIEATMGRITAMKAEIDGLGAGMKVGSSLPSTRLPGAPEGFGRVARHAGGHDARAVLHGGKNGFEAASMLLPFEVTPVTAALAVGAAGVYEATEQQHQAAIALMGGNLDAKAYGLTTADLVEKIKRGASQTGDSFDAVAGAFTAGSRILQGVDSTTRLNLIQGLLGPAEYEAQMKGTSLEESVKSMLELAHQTGTYDVGAIQKMASQFSVASLNSNAGLDQLTNQSSYFLPQLHAAVGLDFASGISLEVAAQNAGLLRAGTSIKNFGENIFAKDGNKKHNNALRAMGLLDNNGKPLWQVFGKDGKVDWTGSEIRIGETIERSLAGMDDTERMNTLRAGFGEQGGRLAALLSTKAFREQVGSIKGRVDQFGDTDLLSQLKQIDPMQQWRETWTDLKNVLGDIGTIVLPPLNLALHGLDEGLKALHGTFEWFTQHFNAGGKDALPTSPNDPRSMPALPGLGGTYGNSAASPMAYYTNDNDLGVQMIRKGVFLAFQDYASGGGVGSSGGGGGAIINAAYTTYGSGGGGGSEAGAASGGGAVPNLRYGRRSGVGGVGPTGVLGAGSIGDGSAVDRAMGMVGIREGDASRALHHVMHAGEWCADFVNGIIQQSGGRGSGSAMARSFMNWGHGVALSQVMKGDVAVLNHGGHVGLFTGERDKSGRLGVVAGNTRDGYGGHMVRHYFVSPGSVFGARRGNLPTVGAPPHQPVEVHIHNTHKLDGKIIAQSTTKHLVNAMYMPASVGPSNPRQYSHPSILLPDAA